jgi:hypothetical protein
MLAFPHAGLLRHIHESAVAIVLIERVDTVRLPASKSSTCCH